MEYKKKLACSVKAFIRAGASDDFIDGFDVEFNTRILSDCVEGELWGKFIDWAESGGYINWLLEEGFIEGPTQELLYRAGDKFAIKRYQALGVIGVQPEVCDDVMLIRSDDYMRLSSLRTGVVGDVSRKCAEDGSITNAELVQLVEFGYGDSVFIVQVG